jgi:2-succinyl-6-hydroxy-2,4-cyclohexadiene-1-carboxylate synthase
MILNIAGINIYFEQYLNSDHAYQSKFNNVILLHGFTGSSEDWKEIIPRLSADFNYYAIDLIGHGNSDSPPGKEFYSAASIVGQLKEFSSKVIKEKFILIGYSMGGRAALSYSTKYPGSIKGLILESSTAGIKNETERIKRIKSDEELSEFIENHSMEEFIDYWMNLDIFNTQKRFANSKLTAIKNSKINNSKTGLSNSLKGFGTGIMPDYFAELKNLNFKTLLITGDLDEKFRLINNEMASSLPYAKHVSLKNSGHNTHLETPDAFVNTVNNFLNEL